MANEKIGSTGKRTKLFDFDRHELPVVLLMFTFFFLFISVFQMLRPLKKGMFIEAFGADVELYAKLLNIVVSAVGVVAFTFLVNRLQRHKVIFSLSIFFAASFLVLSRLVAVAEPPAFSIWGFYLLGDLLTTMMVAAFWAYLTDITYPDQAKRLYGAIGTGGVLGGWLGATISKFLLKGLETSGLLLVAGVLMIILVLITATIESLVKRSVLFRKISAPLTEKSNWGTAAEGARLTFGSKYLLAIMGLMFFYEIGSQVNDYQFSKFTEGLKGLATTQAFLTQASFYANMLAVIVQLFLVSLVMRRFGVTVALLFLPAALILSSVGFFLVPTLVVASFLFISDNGLNYSIQQTSRESLYVVTSPEEKYKSRAFTNMFVQRVAKGLGIFIVIGLGLLGLKGTSTRYLSFITVLVMLILVALSIYAGRYFTRKESEQPLPEAHPV